MSITYPDRLLPCPRRQMVEYYYGYIPKTLKESEKLMDEWEETDG